jgi:hypothetical protein
MSELTTRAMELCLAGLSPTDATAMAIMQAGRSVSPGAVARIELVVSAYRNRLARQSAERRAL